MVDRKSMAVSAVIVLLVATVVVGVPLFLFAFEEVPEGHQGVVKEWGAVTGKTLSPGLHFVIPIQESVQNVETRPRTYTMSQTLGEGEKSQADAITVKTVNGSSVKVDITIRYRVDGDNVSGFVEEWNNEEQMERRLIRPTIRSRLRDEASRLQTTGDGAIYTLQGRQALESTAIESLQSAFEGQPIVLEAVQIRNIDLPKDIDRTLDKKEEAKQQVQIEKQRIRQEKARAEQRRIQAKADADVTRIRGEALRNNPIVLDARLIEAYDKGTVFVTSGSGSEEILIQPPRNATSGSGNSSEVFP